jgi:hypothetical protein
VGGVRGVGGAVLLWWWGVGAGGWGGGWWVCGGGEQRTPFFILNDIDRPEGSVEQARNEDLKVPFPR